MHSQETQFVMIINATFHRNKYKAVLVLSQRSSIDTPPYERLLKSDFQKNKTKKRRRGFRALPVYCTLTPFTLQRQLGVRNKTPYNKQHQGLP